MELEREELFEEIYDLNQEMIEKDDYNEVKKLQKAIGNLKYLLEKISEDTEGEIVFNEEIVTKDDGMVERVQQAHEDKLSEDEDLEETLDDQPET